MPGALCVAKIYSKCKSSSDFSGLFYLNLFSNLFTVKILKGIAVFLAVIVVLAYTFRYEYLFKGIAKTYLRGENSATIDDGGLFPSHTVIAGTAKPWQKDENYNKKKLPEKLLRDLQASKTASFLIIKNGKLLHEEYWDGYSKDSKTNSFSMAKAVTVLLFGKAIDDGKIKSQNELYSDFYDNYANVQLGKNLTLEHLAKMEAGLNWNEDYKNPFSPNAKAYYGNSLAEAVFLKGFKEMPGTRFQYQSGATQLLGFAVRKAVNQPLASYLSSKIWQPLGMEHNAEWNTDDNGMEKTFCCINAIPRDFAKLGQLMLNDGKVDSLQLFNRNFIEQMRTPTKLSNEAYGMGLWINQDAKYKHYYFWGLLGQYIIVVPEKQMVIVRTGSYDNQPKDKKGRPVQVEFIVNQVAENF